MLKKGRKPRTVGYPPEKRRTIRCNLKDVAEAAGVTYEVVRVASSKKLFDRKDLRSIAHYIVATYIKIKLKEGRYYE